MAEEQLEWVFDSLVEFLRGPVWNIPILTFIEQKSVVFEPGPGNEEEFKKIHEDYKNLVDFMLGSYMEDLKITPEQFEKACSVASKTALTQFHQNLFEQVWAADDFEIFRRMMTQKNLELQLQALEVLAQRYGLAPDFMEPGPDAKPTKEEENIMKEVLRRTMEEHQEQPESVENEVTNCKEVAQSALEEKDRLEAERIKEKELMDKAMKLTIKETAITTAEPPPSLPDLKPAQLGTPLSASINQDPPAMPDSTIKEQSTVEPMISKDPLIQDNEEKGEPSLTNESEMQNPVVNRPWSEGHHIVYTTAQIEVNPIEVERRQYYLRQQRDRLLALKKQERTKNLNTYEESIIETRPKSARAARKVLREEDHEVDPNTLAFRKSLASRLRQEVIEPNT